MSAAVLGNRAVQAGTAPGIAVIDRIGAWTFKILGAAFTVLAVAAVFAPGYQVGSASLPVLALAHEVGPVVWLAALSWGIQGALLLGGSARGIWLGLACTPLMASAAALLGADGQPTGWPVPALTPLQVLAQVATEDSLRVRLPLSASIWLAYAGHVLLLLPAMLAWRRQRDLVRARVMRAATLTLPAEIIEQFTGNPLRVLGLRTNELGSRAIVRRRDELLTLLGAGFAPETDLPGYLRANVGPTPPLDEALIKNAVARVQHDIDRCHAVLLWFHFEGEHDVGLDALASGNLEALERAWCDLKSTHTVNDTVDYNLAVLSTCRALAAEQDSAPPHAMRNEEAWRTSHQRWAAVLEMPRCWAGVERVAKQCSDPRIGPDFLRELQETLSLRVLGLHREIALQALCGGYIDYAKVHLDLIRGSPLPQPMRELVSDQIFAPQIEELRRVLGPYLDDRPRLDCAADHAGTLANYRQCRTRMATMGAMARVMPVAAAAVDAACERLPKETYAPWRQFFDSDQACFDGTAKLVSHWNRIAASGRIGHMEIHPLRQVLSAMRERRKHVHDLAAMLRDYEAAVRRVMDAGEVLRVIALDAGDEKRVAVRKLVDDEGKALDRARDELRRTREHFERNLQSMASALDN